MYTFNQQINHAHQDLQLYLNVQYPVNIQVLHKNHDMADTVNNEKIIHYVGRIESYKIDPWAGKVSVFFRGGMIAEINLVESVLEVHRSNLKKKTVTSSQ